MALKKLSEQQIKTYLEMLIENGEEGLFRKAVGMGILRRASNVKNPEIELLDLADAFFLLYRNSGEESHFKMGKVFRRAAHSLFRKLQKNSKKDTSSRFLLRIK